MKIQVVQWYATVEYDVCMLVQHLICTHIQIGIHSSDIIKVGTKLKLTCLYVIKFSSLPTIGPFMNPNPVLSLNHAML